MMDVRQFVMTCGPGEYLAKYSDSESDSDSSCGFPDDALSEINAKLRMRDLRILTDDIGILIVRR